MTETQLRQQLVDQARSWLGRKEADGTHRVIVDVYNSITPLPRGYRVSYTDPWCATFVSACAQVWGLTGIVYPECGCGPMINLYKQHGRWMENDAYVPLPGDIIFYDWDDSGVGDNTGTSDHVGIVIGVSGSKITIIEGNCSDAVKTTYRQVDGRYIRGFGLPDYASLADGEESETPAAPPAEKYSYDVKLPLVQIGDKSGYVKAIQTLLIERGYDCGNKRLLGREKPDGEFGQRTEKAVADFQSKCGLDRDGEVGGATWAALLSDWR